MAHFAKRRIEDASSVHGQKFGRLMNWALSHTVTFTIISLFSFFHNFRARVTVPLYSASWR